MSIGLGLGAFMDGFKDGQSFMEKKADNAYRNELRQRQTDEFKRQDEMRQNIESISTEANQKFDDLVKTGEKSEADRPDFFRSYALPMMEGAYLKRGDLDGASKLRQWGETADAKKGASLSQQAMLALQTGDHIGALNAAMEASKLKGYYKSDVTFTGHEPFVDETGKVLGYRLKGVGKDGKDFSQDVPLAKLPVLIATFTNPEAAWESQRAAASEERKTAKELDVYEQKKAIDRKYGNTGKSRSDAIKSLRERHDGLTGGTAFDDLSNDEKERLIAEELSLQMGSGSDVQAPSSPSQTASASSARAPGLGQPAPAGRQVVMDTVTGQPMREQPQEPAESKSGQALPPDERSSPAAGKGEPVGFIQRAINATKEGLSNFEKDRQQRMAASRQRREAAAAQEVSTKTGRMYTVERAAQELESGADPRHVAGSLRAAGIPEQAWPEAARQDVAARRGGSDPSSHHAPAMETEAPTQEATDAEERAVAVGQPNEAFTTSIAAKRDLRGSRMEGMDFTSPRTRGGEPSASDRLQRTAGSTVGDSSNASRRQVLNNAMAAYQEREPLGFIVKQLRDAKIPEKDWPKPILDEVRLIRREAKERER